LESKGPFQSFSLSSQLKHPSCVSFKEHGSLQIPFLAFYLVYKNTLFRDLLFILTYQDVNVRGGVQSKRQFGGSMEEAGRGILHP
jgi:hypothetical protein